MVYRLYKHRRGSVGKVLIPHRWHALLEGCQGTAALHRTLVQPALLSCCHFSCFPLDHSGFIGFCPKGKAEGQPCLIQMTQALFLG